MTISKRTLRTLDDVKNFLKKNNMHRMSYMIGLDITLVKKKGTPVELKKEIESKWLDWQKLS